MLYQIAYSGDPILLGWNVRFYKSGRTLCRVYPKEGYFMVLFVVGRREKEQVELMLPKMSEEIQKIYQETKEGMGQRWLIISLTAQDERYEDLQKLIKIRKNS